MSAVVKAVHLVDQGAFLIDQHWGVELEVDGLKAPDGQFVVASPETLLVVERKRGEITGYRDAEGATITASEYERQKTGLLEGSRDDEDVRVFPSLDAEFEYRKFMARWSTQERAPDVVTKQPARLEITEVRTNSGDPDIVSLWNAPHVHSDVRLYRFGRDAFMIRLCRELAQRGGIDVDIPHHSALRFAELAGEYAFDDTFGESRPFLGTLAECQAEKQKCADRVRNVVEARIAKARGVPLQNAGAVLETVRAILRDLSNAGGSKNDHLNNARRRARELAAAIEGQIGSAA